MVTTIVWVMVMRVVVMMAMARMIIDTHQGFTLSLCNSLTYNLSPQPMSSFYYYPHVIVDRYWGRRRFHNPLTNYTNSYHGVNKYGKWGLADLLYKWEKRRLEDFDNFRGHKPSEGRANIPTWVMLSAWRSWVVGAVPSEQDSSHNAWLSHVLQGSRSLLMDYRYCPRGW